MGEKDYEIHCIFGVFNKICDWNQRKGGYETPYVWWFWTNRYVTDIDSTMTNSSTILTISTPKLITYISSGFARK